MTILVVGASGATGRLLVERLLNTGYQVKIIVRRANSLPDKLMKHENLAFMVASIHKMNEYEMARYLKDCAAVVSCLGHNMTFKGVFGQPRWLVTDTVRLLCRAIRANHAEIAVKLILMNTSGNSNRDIPEQVPISQTMVTSLLRLLLPPHVDNEKAADFLRTEIGQNDKAIEWTAVRPDGLVNEEKASEYEVYPSPIRNPIFNAGLTSRINVAHFMAELIANDDLWSHWQGSMPVIYNKAN